MTLFEALEFYREHTPRGEYVLVVEGAANHKNLSEFWHDMTVEAHVNHYIAQGIPKSEAIKFAAKDRGVPKNKVYNEYVRLNSTNPEEEKL